MSKIVDHPLMVVLPCICLSTKTLQMTQVSNPEINANTRSLTLKIDKWKRISTLICANPKTKSSGQCFRGKSNKARTDPKCPISARQHRTSNKSSDNHAWLGVPYGSFCPCIFSNCAWPAHKSLIPVVSDICNLSSNTEMRIVEHLTVKRQQYNIQTKIWHSSSEEMQLFLQLNSIQPSGTQSMSWNARHSID